MTIRSEKLGYRADGLDMVGDIYWDDAIGDPRPGVLVFPEAFGLGDHARGRAERLAEAGYAALACDLHGGARILAMDALKPIFETLWGDAARIRDRAGSALAALTARPEVDPARVAAIGYCFGGTMAFELARDGAAIVAAVGFHSGLATSRAAATGAVRGKILACIGADDTTVPPDQRAAFEREMTQAGVDWQLHLYGGVVHSFTEPHADARGAPQFARYDAAADARSWAAMRGLFDEVFG